MFTPRVSALLSVFALSALSASAVPTSALPTDVPSPTGAAAAPPNLHPNVFTVYDPPITAPHAGDVWTSGSQQTVKWDAAKIGADGQNTTARLLLGHQEPGTLTEFLDIKHPLATDFPVNAGEVSFTVPEVLTADNYIVVLVGSVSDSGNASPTFTIQNPKEPQLPSAPVSAPVSSPPATGVPTGVASATISSFSIDSSVVPAASAVSTASL